MSDTIVYACGGCGLTVSAESSPSKPCPNCGLGDSKYDEPEWNRQGRV